MMQVEPIRVLAVDDSAFVRRAVSEMLRSRGFDVVGTAANGEEALEKISELRPDVVTLDLLMPGLDGLGVLRARAPGSRTRYVILSIAGAASELAIQALQLGAVDVITKPTGISSDRLYDVAEDLATKVRAAAKARPLPLVEPRPGRHAAPVARPGRADIVVVGTSTGGPQALSRLLPALPAELPAVAIALHIPPGYTQALAQRLSEASRLEVLEASGGMDVRPGTAILARAGYHLKFAREGERVYTRLDLLPIETLHRPSVDVLFQSAAATFGPRVLAVVLTGMGDDGLAGARAVRAAGGRVLTEHPSTCVIDGMPRSVREAGLSDGEATIDEMAAAIVDGV